jgi:hypothetical protein
LSPALSSLEKNMTHSLKTLTVIALFGGLLACGGESEEAASPEPPPAEVTHADEAADAGHAEGEEAAGECTCDHGKAGETVWCESCSVGYHASERFTCQGCYEASQAGTTHAHEDEGAGEEGAEDAEGSEATTAEG